MPLDDQVLGEYIQTFYGYGSYDGDWWLVGMEEGGGNTEAELETRLRLWNERGGKELEDVDCSGPCRNSRSGSRHGRRCKPRGEG